MRHDAASTAKMRANQGALVETHLPSWHTCHASEVEPTCKVWHPKWHMHPSRPGVPCCVPQTHT